MINVISFGAELTATLTPPDATDGQKITIVVDTGRGGNRALMSMTIDDALLFARLLSTMATQALSESK